MSKSPKKTKHPKDMTTDEALNHIFHPKVVEHVKSIVADTFKTPTNKASKRPLKKG